MTAEHDIEQLYGVKPEDFTALRTKLVAAAKKRGDAEDAKQIAAARRPTTAAWVVNTLVRSDGTARHRLSELSERLRAAHASMDGTRIRELSAAQRKLIDELVRAGFAATGLSDPSAALRDDVTGTLQAAIADPEVSARLGSLTKAEQWSGFGEFGSATAVAAPSRSAEREPEPEPPVATGPTKAEVNAARRRRAVEDLDSRRTKLNTARRRYEKLLESLTAAERELNAADADHRSAERAVQDAADRVETAKSVLAEADSELDAVTARLSR